MTREEILREVNRKLHILETTIEQPDEKLLFLREYLANNSFNRLEHLINVNQADTIKAYLAATTSLDLEEISPMISDFIILFKTEEIEDADLMELLGAITDQLIEDMQESIKNKNQGNILKALKNRLTPDFIAASSLALSNISLEHKKEVIALTKFMKKYMQSTLTDEEIMALNLKEISNEKIDNLADAFSLVIVVKTVRDGYFYARRTIQEVLEDESMRGIKSETQLKKILDRDLSKTIDYAAIRETFSKMVNYYNTKAKAIESRARLRNKAIQTYSEFLTYFTSAGLDEAITDYRRTVSKIPDEKFKQEILKYIYKYNLDYQIPTEEIYNETLELDLDSYYPILGAYSIPRTEETVARLRTKYTPTEVKNLLGQLGEVGIEDENVLYQVLLVSNKEAIDTLCCLAKKEVISHEVLKNYPAIFNSDDIWYKNALTNINTVITAGLNPRYMSSSKIALFAPPEVVKENIHSLKEKELLSRIGKDTNIDFIGSLATNQVLTLATSAGYKKDIEEDIDLLNFEVVKWQRVYIMKEIDMPVASSELRTFLEAKTFFIPNYKLEEYIFDNEENTKPVQFAKKIIPSTEKVEATTIDTAK